MESSQTINIFSQIGMIMLIGLVTKNGILIVEFANQKKHAGMLKKPAVIEAATMRLRPILMTSLAMALGALPLALSLGAASTSRIPLGVVIVGGIMFSLVLTLFVIPAMYSYLSSKKIKVHEEETEAAIKELMDLPEKPDAIFVAGDRLSTGCLSVLKNLKVSIPVAGFSNSDVLDLFNPSLTSVRQPAFEIGQLATQMLLQLIEAKYPIEEFEKKILETELCVRG